MVRSTAASSLCCAGTAPSSMTSERRERKITKISVPVDPSRRAASSCSLSGVGFETHDDEHVFADRHLLVDNASLGWLTGGRHEAGPAWLIIKLAWRAAGFVAEAIN